MQVLNGMNMQHVNDFQQRKMLLKRPLNDEDDECSNTATATDNFDDFQKPRVLHITKHPKTNKRQRINEEDCFTTDTTIKDGSFYLGRVVSTDITSEEHESNDNGGGFYDELFNDTAEDFCITNECEPTPINDYLNASKNEEYDHGLDTTCNYYDSNDKMNTSKDDTENIIKFKNSFNNNMYSLDQQPTMTIEDIDFTSTESTNSIEGDVSGNKKAYDNNLVSLEQQCNVSQRLYAIMMKSKGSQKALQKWDKDNGLAKNHSRTMSRSYRSREKIQENISFLLASTLNDSLKKIGSVNFFSSIHK